MPSSCSDLCRFALGNQQRSPRPARWILESGEGETGREMETEMKESGKEKEGKGRGRGQREGERKQVKRKGRWNGKGEFCAVVIFP